MTRPNPTRLEPAFARRLRAFTLIELLMVVAVISILLASSVPLVRAVLQANALDSGLNQVSAALNTARAVALRDGTDAAVFVLGNPSDGRVNLRIVKFTGTITGAGKMRFTDLDDRPPERLPLNIGIRGYSPTPIALPGARTTNWTVPAPFAYDPNTPGALQSTVYFAVWFGSDGTTRTSTPAGVSTIEYQPVAGGLTPVLDAQPVPLLLIYDDHAFGEYFAGLAPATPTIDNWITDPGISTKTTIRLVNFNRYSGLIVNR
ncbi:MAG: prepilin-type N-terminal cleavage/methylation domain-containing protein [Planctomycetota bacterium]|nr:prepilin-type N-terminal cleavage/methylation domain-containing protein [Planctomycetota bacterium]